MESIGKGGTELRRKRFSSRVESSFQEMSRSPNPPAQGPLECVARPRRAIHRRVRRTTRDTGSSLLRLCAAARLPKGYRFGAWYSCSLARNARAQAWRARAGGAAGGGRSAPVGGCQRQVGIFSGTMRHAQLSLLTNPMGEKHVVRREKLEGVLRIPADVVQRHRTVWADVEPELPDQGGALMVTDVA